MEYGNFKLRLRGETTLEGLFSRTLLEFFRCAHESTVEPNPLVELN